MLSKPDLKLGARCTLVSTLDLYLKLNFEVAAPRARVVKLLLRLISIMKESKNKDSTPKGHR